MTHVCGDRQDAKELRCRWAGASRARYVGSCAGRGVRIIHGRRLPASGGVRNTLGGAVFALEVLDRENGIPALLPCSIAAVAGDWACHAWGVGHTEYHVQFLASAAAPSTFFHLNLTLLAKVVVAALAFGIVSTVFAEASLAFNVPPQSHQLPATSACARGFGVIALFFSRARLIILALVWSPHPGAITIPSFFTSTEIHPWSWL